MLGRGTRTATGKKTCVIYDFSGNVKALGRLEDIKVVKEKLSNSYKEWNVITKNKPTGLHNKPLYKYKIKE